MTWPIDPDNAAGIDIDKAFQVKDGIVIEEHPVALVRETLTIDVTELTDIYAGGNASRVGDWQDLNE